MAMTEHENKNDENIIEDMNFKCFNKRLIEKLVDQSSYMTNMFIDILSILKKYPPAKNENKFIYGKVAEARIIHWINKIIPCQDLDKCKIHGSEYKNDCEISFDESKIKYSIKVSKNGGEPTLINKRNMSSHNVNGCYFIICHIQNEKLYIFKHNESLTGFLKENHESIKYKSKIFNHLDKDTNNFYKFPNNEKIQHFKENILPKIEEVSIYDRLSKELENENSGFY